MPTLEELWNKGVYNVANCVGPDTMKRKAGRRVWADRTECPTNEYIEYHRGVLEPRCPSCYAKSINRSKKGAKQ